MKKNLFKPIVAIALAFTLTSCFTLQYNVGSGAQTGVEVKGKNHYIIYGLAPLSTTDPTTLAGGAENYTVTIQHTFIDGLLNALTFGLYTPTTTKITK